MYKEYSKGIINGSDNHIKQLQYGLYLEFTRFVNCEWPLHISFYNEIKNNRENIYKYSFFLRFEWFRDYDYPESIKYFLDEL